MNHDDPTRTLATRREALKISGVAALAGTLVGVGELSEVAALDEANPGALVIDTHIHAVSTHVPGVKSKPEDVVKLYEGPLQGMVHRLEEEMTAGKVEFAFGMGSLGGSVADPLGISRTLQLCDLVPRLRAVGVADPRRTEPDFLKAAEAQIDRNRNKIVAFKAYLGYLHFGPEHPGYVPYYKLAEKYDLPVIVHTGDNWSWKAKVKYAHPLMMDEVAVDFPSVRFVLAHFGNPWLIDAAEVLFKNDKNVWADLSGLFVGNAKQFQELLDEQGIPESATGLAFSDLKKAIAYVGDYKKFLYGSDWPLAPMASYRRLIEAVIPKKHHHDVFRKNAERVFKVS
jgi:uncharacterized protein